MVENSLVFDVAFAGCCRKDFNDDSRNGLDVSIWRTAADDRCIGTNDRVVCNDPIDFSQDADIASGRIDAVR